MHILIHLHTALLLITIDFTFEILRALSQNSQDRISLLDVEVFGMNVL